MPWTPKQKKVAQAVEHGWKPKGAAKNFARTVRSGAGRGKSLADLIVSEYKPKRTRR